MRWLINYLRSCFCRHDFRIEEMWFTQLDEFGDMVRQGYKVSMICPACGYHKSFWKV